MAPTVAELIVGVMAAYATAGLLFGAVFVAFGIDRVDAVAKGSGVAFRLIVLPGVAALWPLLLRRWLGARG
jgi:hypothetical protein